MNGLIKKCNNKTEVTELLVNDKVVQNPNDVCNVFNNHFIKAGQEVQSPIDSVESDKSTLSHVSPSHMRLKFKKVSELRICKIVDSMKSRCALAMMT